MAIVKIVIKDKGSGNDEFEFHCESYPEITAEQKKNLTLTAAQYIALKVLEYMKDGFTDKADIYEKLLKTPHKSDKGFH